jgi:small subunit ribosomal protein S13
MIYVLNTEISNKKQIKIAFQAIFGIGIKEISNICKFFGISKITTINNLNSSLKTQIILYIEKNYLINSDLKQVLTKIKDQQYQLKTYKASRLRFKLPCRGQRTHTNAKTIKKYK